MRILVTGSKGQLGNELRRCIQTGEAEAGPVPACYQGAEVDYIDFGQLDISRASDVDAWFGAHGPYDLAINCAAMTNVDGCEANFGAAFAANALGPMNLARACECQGTKLVQVSTDYVFPGNVPGERVETDVPAPISAYGRSKLAGEGLALSANPRTFVLRTAWLYGYVGKNFVKTMLRLADTHDHVSVVDDQVGNPTSANDLARQILIVAQTESYGVYHATCNGTCSWADFAEAIFQEFGRDCGVERLTSEQYKQRVPASADRPHHSALRNLRLEQTVGDGMRPWREALHAYALNFDQLAN